MEPVEDRVKFVSIFAQVCQMLRLWRMRRRDPPGLEAGQRDGRGLR